MTYGSESQLAFFLYIFVRPLPQGPPGVMARVPNGVSGSYMDAIFELVVRKESESWTSLPHS